MSKAIQVHATGGPEVLQWEEVDVGEPGPGEVALRHTAIGLNYIDIYFRTGLYPSGGIPFVPGVEGAGVVEAVGEGVTTAKPGDRVAYAARPLGAYSERRLMPASEVVRIPADIDDKLAAAMMLKGMTAHYLLCRTFPVDSRHTILFHAAAGGVGLIACQWAKTLGATVIGTVGSEEKAALAIRHGCDHPIIYTRENVTERVRELTDGKGVDVVYDSVGKDTFDASLDCLKPLGYLVSFGQSSGPIGPFDPGLLAAKGSLFLTRPTLFTYVAERDQLLESAGQLFEIVSKGEVKIEVNQSFALQDAAQAHRALEARETTGSTVLLPQ